MKKKSKKKTAISLSFYTVNYHLHHSFKIRPGPAGYTGLKKIEKEKT